MNLKSKIAQEKLNYKLKESGWYDSLQEFTESESFYQIVEFLFKESVAGREFTPTLKNIFTAFEECHYDKLKTVIVGQDPYPQKGVADGIAFSCSRKLKPEKSLVRRYRSRNNHLRRAIEPGLPQRSDRPERPPRPRPLPGVASRLRGGSPETSRSDGISPPYWKGNSRLCG